MIEKINEEMIREIVRKIVEGAAADYGRVPEHGGAGADRPQTQDSAVTSAKLNFEPAKLNFKPADLKYKPEELIPAEASARHVHLCQADIEALFGAGYELKKKKDISQPGQYICEERVTLIGPKGQLANVAVLGPPRRQTQAELSLTDSRTLGISVPVNMSGDLTGAADVFIMSGGRMLQAKGAAIAAQNHIHMTEAEAERFGVKNGQHVSVRMRTARPLTFDDVVIRADHGARLAFHIDIDEANACGYRTGDAAQIVKAAPQPGEPAAQHRELAAHPGELAAQHEEPAPQSGKRLEPAPAAEKTADEAAGSSGVEEELAYQGKLLTEEATLTLLDSARSRTAKPVLYLNKGTIVTPMARDALRAARAQLSYR